MKKYTVYGQNKESYKQYKWQGAHRKQSDEDIKKIIAEHEARTWAVYKVKDNKTGEIVATNA